MDWMKILSAVALIAMIIYLYPRAKAMAANSPKGSMQDWMGYIVPMAAVILFIILLISMV